MRNKKFDKTCKREKCPYYREITTKCNSCEYNPDAGWTERKAKK